MKLPVWENLGQAVRRRRAYLGLSQADVTAAGGPSDQTLRKLEAGDHGPYRPRTLAALERVLRWKPGAVEAILLGEFPGNWELSYTAVDTAQASDTASASVTPRAIAARDRAVTALLDYADALQEAPARTEVLIFVRRLMEQPRVNA